jgi:hypothetical protein
VKSVVYCFRLNPDQEAEAKAMGIIEDLKDAGYSVKDICLDAVLQRNGIQPEQYNQERVSDILPFIGQMLEQFADEILDGIPAARDTEHEERSEEFPMSDKATTFARSFLERQGK